MLANVIFDCSMNRNSTSLEVRYTIENQGSIDIGAFNRLQGIGVDGGLYFSPNNVFIDLEGDVLHMMKMALPVPPNLQISAYVPPYASLIRAGGTFHETFMVPLPAKVAQPFTRALIGGQVAAITPTTAVAARVTIGIFPLVDDLRLLAEQPAYPDVLSAKPPGPALGGQVLLTQAFALEPVAAVLTYKGFPWT